MCANYEPISKDRVHLLDLFEPTFEYSNDIYPGADCPLLFSNEGNVEWRQVKFGLVPTWAKDLKICRKTYNVRTETVHEKPSFRHAWKNSQFALIPVDTIYEPKYIDGKAHWYGIYRKDGMPFTVAALYENAKVEGHQLRSMTMLTINADHHPFMSQFHAPTDEKRSIIVIPDSLRTDWLNCKNTEARDFFLDMEPDEYLAQPKEELKKIRSNA